MRNWSNVVLPLLIALVLLLATLSSSEARFLKRPGFKQARAIRGFKSMPLQVGRGFGKRANDQELLLDLDENIPSDANEGMPESFPVDWFAEKMNTNPWFARNVLRKFVDANGDGQLQFDELFRRGYQI